MLITNAVVEEIIELENQIYLIKFFSPEISRNIKPGQFLNVKVSNLNYPLLRRPFSVCDVEDDYFYLMFNLFGEGTQILSRKRKREIVEVLGPLGNGFNIDGNYSTAIIVAGGLGVAPFPYLISKISDSKKILSFIGGKNQTEVIQYKMLNSYVSTDDGSLGFKGTIIDLLRKEIKLLQNDKIKIFGCGPNQMLKALKNFAIENNFECEISTEASMACGFGICQGCPIESTKDSSKYLLVCKDGPVFNVNDVVI